MSKLELLVDYKKGFAFKSSDYSQNGTPIVRVSDFTSNSIDLTNCNFIIEENIDSNKHTFLQTDDIVIATVGSWATNPASIVGKVIRVPHSANGSVLNQNTVRLRAKKTEDQVFLYYVLKDKSFSDYLLSTAQGSANQASITLKSIFDYEIPDLSENDKLNIVNTLDSLDKKIELNTQINQTLEQIAQTIFKSWFIDFDPVHAKANALANGQTTEQATQAAMAVISGKNTQELHRLQTANPEQYQQLWEIAEAFPSGVDEEGVPRGWEMTVVKSVCEKIQNGGTPKRSNKEYWNNGNIPWLSSGEVCNNNILVSSKEFITQLGLENSSTKLIEANSTLVALYASPTAGKCSFCAFKATTNQAVCALVPKEIYKYFNFYYLQTKEEYYSNQAVGSAQQNISKGIVENTPILKPDSMILSYFNLIVGGLMNKQISNLKENDHLKRIRDELLPKLLSGEV